MAYFIDTNIIVGKEENKIEILVSRYFTKNLNEKQLCCEMERVRKRLDVIERFFKIYECWLSPLVFSEITSRMERLGNAYKVLENLKTGNVWENTGTTKYSFLYALTDHEVPEQMHGGYIRKIRKSESVFNGLKQTIACLIKLNTELEKYRIGKKHEEYKHFFEKLRKTGIDMVDVDIVVNATLCALYENKIVDILSYDLKHMHTLLEKLKSETNAEITLMDEEASMTEVLGIKGPQVYFKTAGRIDPLGSSPFGR